MSQATTAASGAAASAAIGISILSLSSPMAIWFLANQFQLFSLLLLTNAQLPTDVREYIKQNAFFSFSMDFLPGSKKATENGLLSKMDKEQKYWEFKSLGLDSQSSLVNNMGLFISVLLMILVHLVIFWMPRNPYPRVNKTAKARFNRVMIKLLEIFLLGVYIRFFLEAFQFTLISSVSEIRAFHYDDVYLTTSNLIAVGFFLLTVGFFAISVNMARKDPEDLGNRDSKLSEFNSGLRRTRIVQIYTPMLLIRRYYFVIWLVALLRYDPKILVSGMLAFQIFYMIVLITLRPCEAGVNNLIEIINECIF